ncbi:sugar phosphate isomerase/epimerase family protein [Acidisoma cladoniae]|jgi:D-psicose/D-tagatose/L-ribulose 3-epimerase|uniref:sugar phosphate isomerase/epimerase family protein n=1 Tax=Acidisoma cladoniae TaxID=3040935 RepID=UPI00255134FF|nr:sugar phosphate isomerase/epimerase [Acidisoma sp. PAMC 29798]
MNPMGIHAFVWSAGSTPEDLSRALDHSSALGYSLIEFPRLDPKKFDVPAFAQSLKAVTMGIAVTMGLQPSADISSEDAAVVATGEQVLREAVSVARDLGAQKLGGILFSAHDKYMTMPTARGRQNSIDTLRKVARYGAEAGVTINLEIVNRFESNLLNTTAQGLAFIADIGEPNVYLHLDTFHMNIEEANPADAIRAAGDRLGYFHVGESNRGFLGAGTIDYAPIFDALLDNGYADTITFESFSSAVVDKDLSIITGIWRNTWDDNVALARHAKAFIQDQMDSAARRRRITRTP